MIANILADRDIAVSLVTFEGATKEPYYALHPEIVRVALDLDAPVRFRWWAYVRVAQRIAALRRTLAAIRPDVVISFLTRTNIIALLATRGLEARVIISERNNPEAQRFGTAWEVARARLYPTADAFVTMTRSALEFYPEQQRPRGTIIRNPVEPVASAGRLSDGRTLVAVGRLDRQKGFDLLLEAFAMMADRVPDWRLVIWGDGPERAALEAQRDRLGLTENRVCLPGTSRTPGGWLATSDAFVLSSRFEGWANVLAEAMAAGLPVVAFDCAFGPAEMIEDGVSGLLVKPEDPAALADALTRLLVDPDLRKRFGESARALAHSLEPAAIADEWEALIEVLLAERQ